MDQKSDWDTARLVAVDKKHVRHPFTAMADWCAPEHEPLVLVEGRGALLWDSAGREYIDGNPSIWTNVHGHNNPRINAAIRSQLDLVENPSFLGSTNPTAIRLAEAIVQVIPNQRLTRCFYSDDDSTGVEVALRIAAQYWRLRGSKRGQFLAFRGGYHGDTVWAAALGAKHLFGSPLGEWRYPTRQIATIEALEQLPLDIVDDVIAVVIEPLVQGAAGIRIWPAGTLAAVRNWCDHSGVLMIADEVLTGFGRTGTMFACEQESVTPDLMVLGKRLRGGYLPLALTLLTEEVFAPFLADSDIARTLFYGHSYIGNALGCAAALASLEVFHEEQVLEQLQGKIAQLAAELDPLKLLDGVVEIRQCGFIAGIEGRQTEDARSSGAQSRFTGAALCEAARRHGLLTRAIKNVVVLMLPFCTTEAQLHRAVEAIRLAILEVYSQPAPAAQQLR
ncbi:adenosylmethionine--8-amino-7-oxononanoate transaminase [soil metagenome]